MIFLQMLETLLPPRPEFEMPTGENVEEVMLQDYDPNDRSNSQNSRGEAYQSDEEESGTRIQCPSQ